MTDFSSRTGPASSGVGVKTIYQNAYPSLKPTSPVQPLTPPTMISATANSGCGVDTLDFILQPVVVDNSYTIDSGGNWVWTEVPIKFPTPVTSIVVPGLSSLLESMKFSPVKIGLTSEWYKQSQNSVPFPLFPFSQSLTWYQFCSPVDILYFSYAVAAGAPIGQILGNIIGSNKISMMLFSGGLLAT